MITKVKGKNIPQKKQKQAATVTTNLSSLSGLRKLMILTDFGVWTNLDLKVRLEMDSMNKIRNAQILIAHGKPTCGMRWDTMMGKITPPKLDPAAVIPRAVARRFANQVLTELTLALKTALAPRGLQIPCERMNW